MIDNVFRKKVFMIYGPRETLVFGQNDYNELNSFKTQSPWLVLQCQNATVGVFRQ